MLKHAMKYQHTSSLQQTILAASQAKSEVFQGSCSCVCVFVFPQMSVNPFFCVCGFVGLIINARVSKNVYICVIRQAFVSAGRGAVPSVNANGFAVFDLLLG